MMVPQRNWKALCIQITYSQQLNLKTDQAVRLQFLLAPLPIGFDWYQL